MPTITPAGLPAHHPALVLEFEAARTARTIVHDTLIPGAPGTVTFRPASLRTGTLEMLFVDQDAARACFDAHALPVWFTFTHELRHTWSMTYVVPEGEQIILAPDDDDRAVFVLTVPYAEVTL